MNGDDAVDEFLLTSDCYGREDSLYMWRSPRNELKNPETALLYK